MIEPLARRHGRKVHARRDRRIFGTDRYFARLRVAGYRTHVVLASKRHVPGSRASGLTFSADDWREALADPEALFAGGDVRVVRDCDTSLVIRRTLRVGPHELDVHVKRPRRRKLTRRLRDAFRLSRSLKAFRNGHRLLGRHIHNALPLAAMEKRSGLLPADSILITETADDATHINRFLNRHLASAGADDSLRPGQRWRLAQLLLWELGRLLRRLHQAGFAHRDLKASNLLVRWAGREGRSPDVILVDLDGLRRSRRVSARQRFQGLMRLNVSLLECPAVNHAGRLRMLLGYLRRPGAGWINFKPYWRQLQRWSDRKIRRQIRSRQKDQRTQRRKEP